MILRLLLVVVAVGAAAAGLLGFGVLSSDRRQQRMGPLAAVSAPVVLLGGLAVLAVLVVGVDGGGGGDRAGDGDREPAPAPRAATATTLADARLLLAPDELAVVSMKEGAPFVGVGSLPLGGVVRVKVDGFGWHDKALADQCVTELGRHTVCGPSITVQFDSDGHADFLFVVRGDIAPGGCRLGSATCLLRVRTSDREAIIQTVLGDPYVAGRVAVTARDGEGVDVAVVGFPAGSRATAVLCAPLLTYDARRCSEGLSTFSLDADGAGRTTVTIGARHVGTDELSCGPRSRCEVMVLAEPGYVAAPGAVVALAGGARVSYTAERVLTGILVAVALLGLAVTIVIRTDWTKPTEAATPDLDAADLRSGDSLDDLFGSDEELDRRDPIPW